MPSVAADLEIRPFAEEDLEDAQHFTCGDDDLDDFLRSDALRLQRAQAFQTYVARRIDAGAAIIGYVSLLCDAVHLETKERRKLLLRHEDHPIIPALKIARLCTIKEQQRGGVGTALVRFGYLSAAQLAATVGCRLLTLDAYPRSVELYERLGFVRNRSKEYRDRNHPSMRLDVFGKHAPSWIDTD